MRARPGRWLIRLAWAAAALALLTVAAWWVLLRQIVPNIDQWREPLARQATSALGVPVRIARVEGRAHGWWPEVSLHGVELLDGQGRPALSLAEITARLSPATLSPLSLWRREVHVDRLVLTRPDLEVRRDRQGRLHVAGLTLDPTRGAGEGQQALDWLLDQQLIRIDQGRITWIDELHGATPLRLTQVDLALRHRPGLARRTRQWSLAATPPAEFGRRFTASAALSQPLWSRASATREGAWTEWLGQPTRASDWQTWSGRMEVTLPHVDVSSLRRHVSLPFEIAGGQGRIAATLAVEAGEPRELALDADVRAVSLRLSPGLAPLAFRQVSGTVTARHQPDASSLSWQGLRFTTEDGLGWPASQAKLAWRHPRAAPTPGVLLPALQGEVWRRTLDGQFETNHVDLALLARLADRLPLPAGLRADLARLAPSGEGRNLALTWKGPLDAPIAFDAHGRLSRLGWQAGAQLPGLNGATVDFTATQEGGRATLVVAGGWAEFPGVFEEPRVPIQTLQAEVDWTITPRKGDAASPDIALNVRQARFANDDARGELQATWRTGAGQGVGAGGRYPGQLDLRGRLSHAEGTRVWRYLPATILADARHYVRDAVKGGVGENVRFETRGDLALFPFKDDEGGRFYIDVPARNVTLDYVPRRLMQTGAKDAPHWPAFTALQGRLIFEGQRMRIEGASALLGEVGSGQFAVRQVQGRIEDLAAQQPRLTIRGTGDGPVDDLLAYVNVSPVGQWTGRMLSDARGQGRAGLSLSLDIPLTKVEDAVVTGQVSWAERDQASLRLGPRVPALQNVKGQLEFTQDTLKVAARARVWGEEVQIQGSRDAQGAPRFTAEGTLSAEGLRTAEDMPELARLARRLTGRTPVTVTVALNRVKAGSAAFSARPELQVTSDLQGLGMDLPAPLSKPAEAAWPLKVSHRVDDDGGHDALLLELGMGRPGEPSVRADYRRTLAEGQASVARGAFAIAQSAPATLPALPAQGVAARVALPALDADAWLALMDEVRADAGPGTSARQASAAGPPAASASPEAAEDYLPDTLTLRTGALTWRERVLRDVSLTLAHPSPGLWRAQIDAPQVAGQIEVRPEQPVNAGTPPGSRIVARLTRLRVPAAEADAFEERAAPQAVSAETTSVPALDIVIEQFEWRGLALGRLEVEAINRLGAPTGPGMPSLPEWRLTRFRLDNPEAQLNATGRWSALPTPPSPPGRPPAARHRAAFTFSLDLANSGALLGRLGLPQTLKGGKGRLSGQVAWLGSPLEPHVPSLSGEINVAISEGQFLKVEPGVAKLLGVLSLQSLPRRLVLDFRDVFQSGFAFDRIEGDAKISQGVAATRNLRMRGVQALVLMEGQADLTQETQNLRVFVVPEINAGTASLAYAAINPAVGLGTFIAQVLLRKTVVEANTREFTVTGSWADPQVERVPRSTVPLPSDEPPGKEGAGVASASALPLPAPPSTRASGPATRGRQP